MYEGSAYLDVYSCITALLHVIYLLVDAQGEQHNLGEAL